MTESRRRLAAIMFTDLVGYSAMAQADETAALAVLERHNRLIRPNFEKFRGREIKTVGDAFLVEFESALDAVRSALEIQRSLAEYNTSSTDSWKIRVRIGIHVGDVVEVDGDVLGDAVNIASRIQSVADPGGISITQQVYDQVQNKIPTQFMKLPPVALKNIRLPMNVYKVASPADSGRAVGQVTARSNDRHLAVLPLTNISPDPNDGYFADGLTEELISQLSQVRDLSVIARTSVAPYKLAPKSIPEVGAELGVDTVLEGSVRKAGKRIRITLQLIDVGTQRHIWASNYDRDIDDVFAVQTDIAERTAQALRLELSRSDQRGAARIPTANPAAYDQYLRGLVAGSDPMGKGYAEAVRSFDEAVQCFRTATELDPGFSEAYAAWANLLVTVAGETVAMRDVMPQARELAARALALDPESSDAHSALANTIFQFDQDWERAEAEFNRAISLNPSNVTAHRFLALLLMALERFDEAKEISRRTIRLDPGGAHGSTLAWIELESGNFDTAIERAEHEVRDNPSYLGPHTYLGMCYLKVGRRDDALHQADTPLGGADDSHRFDFALLNAMLGRPTLAREVLKEVEQGEAKSYTSATHLAMVYATLGEKSKALDLLEKDFREGDRVLWLYYRGLFFDSIRDDPRFTALLRQYKLPVHSAAGARSSPH
ncbi:MAG: tetratricopeptide repeat protein [Thermoplasmata archaeon]